MQKTMGGFQEMFVLALTHTIVLQGIRTGGSVKNTMSKTVGTKIIIDVFNSIVSSLDFKFPRELSLNNRLEIQFGKEKPTENSCNHQLKQHSTNSPSQIWQDKPPNIRVY